MDNVNSLIDWSQPWLRHLPDYCYTLQPTELYKQLNAVSQLTHNANSKLINFVAQDDLPEGIAYETHIFQTGSIPTRNNLHDLFNACVWFSFPQTKIWLNQQQSLQIDMHGVTSKRGSVRDAITLFDENGAILVTSNTQLATALNSFDWHNSLVQPRGLWNKDYQSSAEAQAEVYIFGHALLEQLVAPRKPLCSHTLTIMVEDDWFSQTLEAKRADLDTRLKQFLIDMQQSESFTTKSYQPLPILGIPHFWQENEDLAFYDDSFVFRSGRHGKKKKKQQ